MNKVELRKIYLQKRSDLSASAKSEMSQRIAGKLFETIDFDAFDTLHCFVTIARLNEVDSSWIYRRIWSSFPRVRTIAPRVDRETGRIQHFEFANEVELSESDWGIREPRGTLSLDPGQIDIIVVPLLCYDAFGFRVGYGKGYYDKFLSECRPDAVKIGLSYFNEAETITDLHSNDIRLDLCITADGVVRFQN